MLNGHRLMAVETIWILHLQASGQLRVKIRGNGGGDLPTRGLLEFSGGVPLRLAEDRGNVLIDGDGGWGDGSHSDDG